MMVDFPARHVWWHRRYLQKILVLRGNMMTNPTLRCRREFEPQSSDSHVRDPFMVAQNLGPSWSHGLPYSFPFLAIFQRADQPQKRHRAQPFGAPAQKSNGRPAWAAWQVMVPSQALDIGPWTCDSSNSNLDKSISLVGNLRIQQDSLDSLQAPSDTECTAYLK